MDEKRAVSGYFNELEHRLQERVIRAQGLHSRLSSLNDKLFGEIPKKTPNDEIKAMAKEPYWTNRTDDLLFELGIELTGITEEIERIEKEAE